MEVAGGPGIANRSLKKIVGFVAGKKGLEVHVKRGRGLEENVRGKDRLVRQEKLCVSFEGESLF